MISTHGLGQGGGCCAGACEGEEVSDRYGRGGGARPVDHARLQRAVREMLIAVGEDPDREGLLETPARVSRAYAEMFKGLREDAGAHLSRVFEHASDELVLLTNISFSSMCEHHLLPFMGRAHVAYLPSGGRVVGLSKLARTVDVFARRPQLQERLTAQVADALVEHLSPEGVMVVVEAEHLCMKVRGANKQEASMFTVAQRGVFKEDAARASMVLELVRSRAR